MRSEHSGATQRVVVVGMGAMSPQGAGAAALWEGVRAGHVAIRPVKSLPMNGYRSSIAGEIQFAVPVARRYRHPRGRSEPAIDFALAAVAEALAAAGIDSRSVPSERWAVVMGTCFAGINSFERWLSGRSAGTHADPRLLLLAPPQALAESVSAAFGTRGPTLAIDTACASGANAVGYAADLIRNGRADVAIAGGSDALCDLNFAGFSSVEALSPRPSAPFTRTRDGLNLGEGSGILLLAREQLANDLGLGVLAEVAGYGLSADGFHPTAPDPGGAGAARAMTDALRSSGVTPEEIGYINSHGTGTSKNDVAETRAIRRSFGPAANDLLVSSTKSMIGHLTGAAGAAEAVVTVSALRDQIAPPTANFTEPDPACDLDYVPNTARPFQAGAAISNNFGFGGANACLVFARPGRTTAPPIPAADRIVVTGISTLLAPGVDVDEAWTAFEEGWNVLREEDGVRLGRVLLHSRPFLTRRQLFRLDAFGLFTVVAAQLAIRQAGLVPNSANQNRIGTVLGTALGPMQSIEEFLASLGEHGADAANPTLFPNVVFNGAAGYVAMHLGARGPTSTVSAGHAAGATALACAYDLLRDDRCDAVIVVGADVLTNTIIRAYRDLGLLHGGEQALGLSEAGVALVLERRTPARERGAPILGEIRGYGMTSDATGPGRFDRDGGGLERAMRLALEAAGVERPDSIWLNAAGHGPADRAEQAAIGRLWSNSPPQFAPKRMFGEPMGVGGLVNTTLALKRFQLAPATGGEGIALVNSSSLGGSHVALAIGHGN